MMPLAFSLRSSFRPNRLLLCLLGAGTLLSGATGLRAANVEWDPTNNGTPPDGGSGPWNLTSPFWLDTVNGGDIAYPNTGTDIAQFITTNAGTVTTAAAIQVNQMIFGTTGYTIANGAGGSLTLSGTTPTINVNTAGVTDTISAVMGGTAGLTKSGPGTLILSAANTYTGTTTINGGTLQQTSTGAFGPTSATVTAPTVAFTGRVRSTWAATTGPGII